MEDPMTFATVTIETPLGCYALLASETGLRVVRPIDCASRAPAAAARASADAQRMLARASAAFTRYFAGDAHALAALPIDPVGSDFQRRVWQALREIAPGETASYGA